MAWPKGPRSEKHKANIAAALTGRMLSDAHKAAISAGKFGKPGRAMSDENKAALKKANTGSKRTPEAKAIMAAKKKGKPGYWTGKERGPLTPEWAHKIAVGNKGRIAAYPKEWTYYDGKAFRSPWEALLAQEFDLRQIRWEYESTRVDIGPTETYLPDFYLPDHGVYWEVKGYFGPKSQRTIAMFRQAYPNIPVIVATKQILRGMGLRLR